MISNGLSSALRAVTSTLLSPVVIILLALIVIAIILVGTLIIEAVVERRHLKVKMSKLVNDIESDEKNLEETIKNSGLLKKHKALLLELAAQKNLNDVMRESLAARLLSEAQGKYSRIIKVSDMIAKLGPMLGLMGTLIPLGPGIIALGQGDTLTLSESLLTAFDTTVAGLVCAAVALVVSAIRKSWYSNYMSLLEASVECVIEKESNNG